MLAKAADMVHGHGLHFKCLTLIKKIAKLPSVHCYFSSNNMTTGWSQDHVALVIEQNRSSHCTFKEHLWALCRNKDQLKVNIKQKSVIPQLVVNQGERGLFGGSCVSQLNFCQWVPSKQNLFFLHGRQGVGGRRTERQRVLKRGLYIMQHLEQGYRDFQFSSSETVGKNTAIKYDLRPLKC